MSSGLSGGELKCVTRGDIKFGLTYMTLMDVISTGLDSVATFSINNKQRGIGKTLRKKIVISLTYPDPEVFVSMTNTYFYSSY